MGESLFNLAFLALQLWVLVVMFQKRALFPRLFTWLWIAGIMLPIVDAVFVSVVLDVSVGAMLGEAFKGHIGPLIVFGLWVLYVRKSVRVKNTFVN